MMAMSHLSLTLAVALGVMVVVILALSIRDWCDFHDERAARGVLMALILVSAGVGSIASAFGLWAMSSGNVESVPPVTFGSAVARMAMVVGAGTYIVVSIRRRRGR